MRRDQRWCGSCMLYGELLHSFLLCFSLFLLPFCALRDREEQRETQTFRVFQSLEMTRTQH
ncbi:hypothetical protein AMELA_G00000020 [Ameiurus melas]|uniref:Uncharacterized protein n=1 Tax=Ameiurus melas TaxID=219545 RepID=A0A7J6BHK9_AMEME|nr:hypothetical protein AMELA_G00000020 [Ameiurus melas]